MQSSYYLKKIVVLNETVNLEKNNHENTTNVFCSRVLAFLERKMQFSFID